MKKKRRRKREKGREDERSTKSSDVGVSDLSSGESEVDLDGLRDKGREGEPGEDCRRGKSEREKQVVSL